MMGSETVQITDIIGVNGKYQMQLYVFSTMSECFFGASMQTVQLLAPMVNISWNWDTSKSHVFLSNDCKMTDIMELNRTSNLSNANSKLTFESPYSRRTLTEELGMVCEEAWRVSFANLMFFLGTFVTTILMRLSERYGRNPLIVQAGLSAVALSFCLNFNRGYIMFVISILFFRAITQEAVFLAFIQSVEVTSPSRLPYVSVIIKSGTYLGQAIFVFAAWILKDWFYIELFQSVTVLAYLIMIWYVMESPVWLAVRGRYEEARAVLVTIIKRNGLNLQEAEPKINMWLEQIKVRCELETKAEKGRFTDLFKNKIISLYTCGLTISLAAGTTVYSGLVMNAESFGSGLYLDLGLSSVLSMVAVLALGIVLIKVSVRVVLISSSLLVAAVCATYPITYEYPLARTIVTVLGRIFIAPARAMALVYGNHVYPTSVRAVASGTITFSANILSFASPYAKELGEATHVYVPFILYAVINVIASVVFMLLPETKGKPIIHTVKELKNRRGKAAHTISTRP